MAGIGTPVAAETVSQYSHSADRSRVDAAHQHQVHEQQVHRRVADPLADAERGAVQPRRAGLERGQRVGDGEVAIAVAVPVDADSAAALVDHGLRRTSRPPPRPAGVAWPTVSAMQTRVAPARIAVEYSARSVSGSARVVSSVTYMTGSPSRTAKAIASSVSFSS